MVIPRYMRMDNMEPSVMTVDEVRPFIRESMLRYIEQVKDEYGQDLLSLDDLIETSLKDHHIVLINGEFLFAFYIGSEWFSSGKILMEEYLMRIAPGSTRLSEVFDIIRLLVRLHGAKEAQLAPGHEALKRHYLKHGAEESLTIMRIT